LEQREKDRARGGGDGSGGGSAALCNSKPSPANYEATNLLGIKSSETWEYEHTTMTPPPEESVEHYPATRTSIQRTSPTQDDHSTSAFALASFSSRTKGLDRADPPVFRFGERPHEPDLVEEIEGGKQHQSQPIVPKILPAPVPWNQSIRFLLDERIAELKCLNAARIARLALLRCTSTMAPALVPLLYSQLIPLPSHEEDRAIQVAESIKKSFVEASANSSDNEQGRLVSVPASGETSPAKSASMTNTDTVDELVQEEPVSSIKYPLDGPEYDKRVEQLSDMD
jgi:hypothetical protein